ncbi:MAG TPA: P22 phage major capsid protein family protein [Bryobacteraceae bacterium]|nr:P22 phage major capsid protein family protein [Bryobacteraceae bacterium]HOQ46192.1 P22 phage major capsid protein family protein [Bryobacteraceae bacterium]HPQ14370.1 P22 phage major capsid protein family protein [Bryobacteraceae bacterium]HPU74413.1 P22 phage major capsid protein family protein [Bryobacteraceae bacterium]
MPAITSTNVANAIVKMVAVDALPALMGNLVMGNLVNRDFEPTLAQSGDTVNVPIPPVLEAHNLAQGGTVQPQNPSLGNAQIVLDTHAEATFLVPDVTKVLAVPDLLKLYMQPAMIALAEKIETDLLNLYSRFTANTPVGTPGTPITEEVIDAAETALFEAKVPASEPKYLVVDSATYSALRQIPRFSEYEKAGDAGLRALVDGTVGKIKDFYVFRSQFVAKTGSAPVTTHNLAFARSAIGLVIRRLPQPLPGTGAISEYAEVGNFGMRVTLSYQPNTLAQQFTVDVLYGVGVLRNSFGVQVNS